jgi:hypothetical protein
MNRILAPLLLAAAFLAATLDASAQSAVRVRGTVDNLEGLTLTVKARSGEMVRINLAEKYVVAGVSPATLADVTAGKFIGTATLGQKDGALVALEVLIFPEAMRGANEGHYPWDLQPESLMTNATVADVAAGAKDRTLTLKYKDGEKKVLVPEGVPIVTFVPAERSELRPGVHVFVGTARQPDGSLTAGRVNVGLNGLVPPM